jgi:hypothetical protein
MNFLVGFLVGISVGTWVFSRLMRNTGGNTKSALIVAGFAGGGAFLVFFLLARALLHN